MSLALPLQPLGFSAFHSGLSCPRTHFPTVLPYWDELAHPGCDWEQLLGWAEPGRAVTHVLLSHCHQTKRCKWMYIRI